MSTQGLVSAPARPALRCPVCDSAASEPWAQAWDAEYLTTEERFEFHRCKSCGVLHIDPVPSDRLSDIYPTNYYAFAPNKTSAVHAIKDLFDRRLFRKVLRKIPGTSLSVLDVGGGSGWHLDGIRQIEPRVQFTQVVDMDAAAEDLAVAKGHAYFRGLVEEFEADRKFDLVLLLNLIEHVQDPLAVLEKVSEMLSPRGVVLVKTPNYDSLDARIFRRRNWGGYHCPRHWVLFTRETFTAMADRAGLAVKSFAYTQGAPFWAISILFWLADRGLVSVTKKRPAIFHPLFPVLSGLFAGFDFIRKPFSKTSQMFFILGRHAKP